MTLPLWKPISRREGYSGFWARATPTDAIGGLSLRYKALAVRYMYLKLAQLLKPRQVARIVAMLAEAPITSGVVTAGALAASVKSNIELAPGKIKSEIGLMIKTALMMNDEFKSFALPRRILEPEIARYGCGMMYGDHVDAAIFNMHADNAFRTDLSMTLFLTAITDYSGGELVIREESQETQVKFDSGDAIVYSADARHSVAKVDQGTRLVAVTWIQSYVKDSRQRNILHTLTKASNEISEHHEPLLLLSQVYNSLLRMWSDV